MHRSVRRASSKADTAQIKGSNNYGPPLKGQKQPLGAGQEVGMLEEIVYISSGRRRQEMRSFLKLESCFALILLPDFCFPVLFH